MPRPILGHLQQNIQLFIDQKIGGVANPASDIFVRERANSITSTHPNLTYLSCLRGSISSKEPFFYKRCRPYGATATFLGSVQPFRMLYPRSALIHYALSVFGNQASRPGGRAYRRGSVFAWVFPQDSEIPPTGIPNASTYFRDIYSKIYNYA